MPKQQEESLGQGAQGLAGFVVALIHGVGDVARQPLIVPGERGYRLYGPHVLLGCFAPLLFVAFNGPQHGDEWVVTYVGLSFWLCVFQAAFAFIKRGGESTVYYVGTSLWQRLGASSAFAHGFLDGATVFVAGVFLMPVSGNLGQYLAFIAAPCVMLSYGLLVERDKRKVEGMKAAAAMQKYLSERFHE